MRHRLFSLCSALSLMLCVTACMSWVCSYRTAEYIGWVNERGSRSLGVAQGHVELCLSLGGDWTGVPFGLRHERTEKPESVEEAGMTYDTVWTRRGRWSWAGFDYGRWGDGDRSVRVFAAPIWCVLALGAMLPGYWLATRARATRERQRRRNGLCSRCAYDLRASPQRCPECGTRPAEAET